MEYADFVRLHYQFGSLPERIPRRHILQSALMLGTSVLLSDSEAARQKMRPQRKVVVVGAGLAGLASAYELSTLGYDVVVIESRDRVGGRVHSLHDLAKDRVIEAGGEFIGSNHPVWIAYAGKFHIALAKGHTGDEQGAHSLLVDGQKLNHKDAEQLYREMEAAFAAMTQDARSVLEATPWQSPHAANLDRKSIADWIAHLACAPRSKRALRAYFTGLNGVEPERQSYLAMLAAVKGGGLERYWTDSETYRCRGGNQQLAMHLASKIKALHLGLAVSAIRIERGQGTVTCADGRVFEADDVVLAIPPSVWRKIAFSPALPQRLHPQMGANVKYLALVRRRFWRDHHLAPDASSDHILHSVWEGTALAAEEENAVLTAFTGGKQATEFHRMTASERDTAYQQQLEVIFPGFRKNFLSARFIDWVGDPWSQGSYSFPAPGQVVIQGPLLDVAYRHRLHFAGEHVCLKFVGYMEGALQSGVAVARRIASRDGISQ